VTKFKDAPVKNQGKKVWHPLENFLALLLYLWKLLFSGQLSEMIDYSPVPNIDNVSFIFFWKKVPLFFAY